MYARLQGLLPRLCLVWEQSWKVCLVQKHLHSFNRLWLIRLEMFLVLFVKFNFCCLWEIIDVPEEFSDTHMRWCRGTSKRIEPTCFQPSDKDCDPNRELACFYTSSLLASSSPIRPSALACFRRPFIFFYSIIWVYFLNLCYKSICNILQCFLQNRISPTGHRLPTLTLHLYWFLHFSFVAEVRQMLRCPEWLKNYLGRVMNSFGTRKRSPLSCLKLWIFNTKLKKYVHSFIQQMFVRHWPHTVPSAKC